MQFGRYYEEFEVGAVYRHWPGKTVTEYDDHLFCLLTMNHHPLHMDAHYAESASQFKRNVVVGNLVYSLVLGMSVPDVSGAAIANLEVEMLQHKFPTFHGDTIHAETRVLDVNRERLVEQVPILDQHVQRIAKRALVRDQQTDDAEVAELSRLGHPQAERDAAADARGFLEQANGRGDRDSLFGIGEHRTGQADLAQQRLRVQPELTRDLEVIREHRCTDLRSHRVSPVVL